MASLVLHCPFKYYLIVGIDKEMYGLHKKHTCIYSLVIASIR